MNNYQTIRLAYQNTKIHLAARFAAFYANAFVFGDGPLGFLKGHTSHSRGPDLRARFGWWLMREIASPLYVRAGQIYSMDGKTWHETRLDDDE